MSDVLLYGGLAALATIIGGIIPLKMKMNRQKLLYLIAITAGVLIAVSFLDIIPEAIEQSAQYGGAGILAGFLLMYFVEQFAIVHPAVEYSEECELHRVSLIAFAGLLFHSIIDGVAIGASLIISPQFGAIVAAAVLLHEFPEGLASSSLLLATKYSKQKIFGLTALVAVATPAGAILSNLYLPSVDAGFLAAALGISAGTFLYIGCADLLPRLHKQKDFKTIAAFLAGIAAVCAAAFVHAG